MPSKPKLPSSQCAKSWRHVLPVHPAAELFPMMLELELKELGEDIKNNKLKSPIAIYTSKNAPNGPVAAVLDVIEGGV
jgi:hypothetical protein